MQISSNPAIKKLYQKIKKTAAALENLLNQISEKIATEKTKTKKSNKTKRIKPTTVSKKSKSKSKKGRAVKRARKGKA